MPLKVSEENLKLLEENWDSIVKKVIEPLWRRRFRTSYENSKLDINDFYSLAGEELTKGFITYNDKESNIYTYATHILSKKPLTELRDVKREKRLVNLIAESVHKQMVEQDTTLQDIIEDKSIDTDYADLEVEMALKEINQVLRGKEKKIIELSMNGMLDQDIATKLNIDSKDICAIRNKLKNNSIIRRTLRNLGYSLGGIENEI